jgi:hypothetical protein
MRAEGFEPPSSFEHRDLSPACRPFQHARGQLDCRNRIRPISMRTYVCEIGAGSEVSARARGRRAPGHGNRSADRYPANDDPRLARRTPTSETAPTATSVSHLRSGKHRTSARRLRLPAGPLPRGRLHLESEPHLLFALLSRRVVSRDRRSVSGCARSDQTEPTRLGSALEIESMLCGRHVLKSLAVSVPATWTGQETRATNRSPAMAGRDPEFSSPGVRTRSDPQRRVSDRRH